MADDDTRLEEIRDRLRRASPGPWTLSKIPAHDADGAYYGCDIARRALQGRELS